jgi:hypothetical protein
MMPLGGVWRIVWRLIHRGAWKRDSPKSVYGKLHSSTLGNRHRPGREVVSRQN